MGEIKSKTRTKNFLYRDVKEFNIVLLLLIGVFLISIAGYTSYALFSQEVTSNNVIKGIVGKLPCKNCVSLYNTVAEQTLGTDTENSISYSDISSDTNGKGVYTFSSTASDDNPVYFYRGAATNNNVVFGKYCWKIVRTTSTGGVKLIYNGEPTYDSSDTNKENPQCTNTTGTATQLSLTSKFNSNKTSPADIGYYYGTRYAYSSKTMTTITTILTSTLIDRHSAYYYADNIKYEDGNYILYNSDGSNVTSYTWSSNRTNLVGYYRCEDGTQTSCDSAYYIAGTAPSYAYTLSLSGGNYIDDVDTNVVLGTSYTDNGDETYTLSGTTLTIKKSEWDDNYSSYKGYYTCGNSNTTCSSTSMRYITSTLEYQMTSSEADAYTKYKYGNSVTYSNGIYTLNTVKENLNWTSGYSSLSSNHYTCFDEDCSTVYYIYFTNSSTAYYISLTGGKTVEDALEEMYSNDNPSTIATYINTWYASEDSGMTKLTHMLENEKWCNDRSVYALNGWNPNGGSTTSYMYYGAYGRVVQTYSPSIECPNNDDAFTLSVGAGGTKDYGNNVLSYPVGLLTADEIMLAGGKYRTTNSTYYLYTNQVFWSSSPYGLGSARIEEFITGSNSSLSGGYVISSYGVRPSVSLVPQAEVLEGADGTSTNPYIVWIK